MARRQSLIRARRMRRAMAAGGDSDLVTGQILEMVSSECNGRTVTSEFGSSVSFQNPGATALSTTYADIGGTIVSYKPPAGTRTVIYEIVFHSSGNPDTHNIFHTRFYIDGVEITNGRRTYGGQYHQAANVFKFPIHIIGSDSNTTGDRASWDTAKELKIQMREYGASNEETIHRTNHWDGAGTNIVVKPVVTLTAIG